MSVLPPQAQVRVGPVPSMIGLMTTGIAALPMLSLLSTPWTVRSIVTLVVPSMYGAGTSPFQTLVAASFVSS
jgi:hypothetical protein